MTAEIRSARWQGRFTRAVALRAQRIAPTKESPDMLLIEKVIMLETVPMFAQTADELLAEIAAAMKELDVRAGDTIFEKGDVGESMYVIAKGRVRVFDADAEHSILAAREVFGELALLDPQPRSASVMATAGIV